MGSNLYFDSKIEGLNLDLLKYKYNMDFVSNSIPVHKSGLIEIKKKIRDSQSGQNKTNILLYIKYTRSAVF